ncbi:LysR family transcriptional regulator [Pseudonocardia sp. GCM10023141]|uniref:LysR family transcriptional regulator n=1 Tax=Pseudonocardia sp. GCM10023141 TaxID=3252653 RepID=UPI00360EE9E5
MSAVLDIVPLRSFVAVADCGGFHRAAKALHLSQPTISDHIRRLETAAGQPLMQRVGRHSKVTAAGEILLVEARRMLAIHDETLRKLGADSDQDVIVGATEHAADQLLPELSGALEDSLGVGQVRYRLDRGARLRESLARGDIDLALLLGEAEDERSADAGLLSLQWYSAPGWTRPPGGEQVQLVAFDEPCALRQRALETLAGHDIPAAVVCDAAYLAGVLAAARAGLGVALLATLGTAPEGLVRRTDLPAVAAMPLSVRSRAGLRAELGERAAVAVREVLGSDLT